MVNRPMRRSWLSLLLASLLSACFGPDEEGERAPDSGVDDACEGVVCDAPPALCEGDSRVVTSGRCLEGRCEYEEQRESCAHGCSEGACIVACDGVVCEAPPAPTCRDESTRVTFAGAGSCVDGACTYEESVETCEHGCADGGCLPPGCCGCLCADSSWSCPATTCVRADGKASSLEREVGFLELATAAIDLETTSVPAQTARIWYAFFPADEAPEDKPVLLFFNGGPGGAALLIGLGTAPLNLNGAEITENPASWTRFANLLYVDPQDSGFSYSPLAAPFSADQDAALYTRALLGFLARHPLLRDNRIGIVGESYGGVRATIMLEQILGYESVLDSPYLPSLELYDALVEHFAAVHGGDGTGIAPATIAEQFAYQVLIQPAIGRYESGSCGEGGRDYYHCGQPSGWSNAQIDASTARVIDPGSWAKLFGADLGTVEWLLPAARTTVSGKLGWGPDESALSEAFGDLGEEDRYYLILNDYAYEHAVPSYARAWRDNLELVRRFVDNTRLVRTLVTDAEHDSVVRSNAIPRFIRELRADVLAVRHDSAPRPGVARPGWVQIDFRDDTQTVTEEFRMPFYAGAGHTVPLSAARELADDVEALLVAP
jgi:hypothetical protein